MPNNAYAGQDLKRPVSTFQDQQIITAGITLSRHGSLSAGSHPAPAKNRSSMVGASIAASCGNTCFHCMFLPAGIETNDRRIDAAHTACPDNSIQSGGLGAATGFF
jgi:hypothetical protein